MAGKLQKKGTQVQVRLRKTDPWTTIRTGRKSRVGDVYLQSEPGKNGRRVVKGFWPIDHHLWSFVICDDKQYAFDKRGVVQL